MPHIRPSLRAAVTVVTALALVATVAPAASADQVAQPPSPGVIGPYPTPGSVVGAGRVEIAAFLVAQAGVSNAEVYVDGVRLEGAQRSGDVTYQRLSAATDVTRGRHTVQVDLVDANGASASRSWTFTAGLVATDRLAGDGRVQTSVAISQSSWPAGGPRAVAAVLARAEDFPDALAGAPLATAVDGPLLLTSQAGLTTETAAELRRVLPAGATVYLLGGRAALSDQVAADVEGLGFTARRVSGTDRYGTAAATGALLPDGDTAVVASGLAFPDALAASSPAARDGMPILLTTRESLPSATRQFLADGDFTTVYVVGGTAVVSEQVVTEIDGLAGSVHRLAGDGRFDTAAAVADRFFADADTVAVASGTSFPDALSGGPHAAAQGAPMLLSSLTNLPTQHVDQIARWQPSKAYVYGGGAVLWDTASSDVSRAIHDTGGPRETDLAPGPNGVTNSLDTLTLTFDRGLQLAHSSVFVTLDGHEVYGTIAQGDFDNSVVFSAGALPIEAQPHRPYPVRVTASVFDGSNWRHLEYQFSYIKLDLSRGDAGEQVRALQNRLMELGYWLGTADGNYGSLMTQAVMAFQKAEGLSRTGSVDTATRERLEVAGRPQPRHSRSGRWVEIDKTRQIMMFIQDGYVQYTFNTSTGHGRYYNEDGHSGYAITPEGSFTFFRQIDGMREADLGQMWRPKYFTDRGHAIHGSTSIPAYPASHGCARLSYPAINYIWDADLAPIGTPLYVYS